jgi:DNA polymerase-1
VCDGFLWTGSGFWYFNKGRVGFFVGNGPRLFIDNYAQNKDNILYFKEYFQNQNYKKIWNNYGLDRHVINNCGIDVKGFAGDTNHMARLENPNKIAY